MTLRQGTLAYDSIRRQIVEVVGAPHWADDGKYGVRSVDDRTECYIRTAMYLKPLAPLEALGKQADE